MRELAVTRRRVAILGLGVTIGAVSAIGINAFAGPAAASPAAGQFCSPHGAVYKTANVTLLCAPTKTDIRFRWRSITIVGPRGPAGARGPAGPTGPIGPRGLPGVAGNACPTGTRLPFIYGYPQGSPTAQVTAVVCVVAGSTQTATTGTGTTTTTTTTTTAPTTTAPTTPPAP